VNILGERYSYIYLFVTQSHSFPRFCQLHVLVDCTILPVQYRIVQSSPTYPYPTSACNHTISASKFRSPTSSEPIPLHNAHIATVHAVLCLDFSSVPSASTFPGGKGSPYFENICTTRRRTKVRRHVLVFLLVYITNILHLGRLNPTLIQTRSKWLTSNGSVKNVWQTTFHFLRESLFGICP
jgi:hypothetical protein